MNKALILSFFIFLASCSKQTDPYSSFDDAQQALISLNSTLNQDSRSVDSKNLVDLAMPFTASYLDKRHGIYQRLMDMQLTQAQVELVNYLVIAERSAERYFAWPAQVNVLNNMLSLDSSSQSLKIINQWLKFSQQQLDDAKASNLKLNKIELMRLKRYVHSALVNEETPNELLAQLNTFNEYLTAYQPRGNPGLRGLANGSEWYQSKLNYYSGKVHPPLQWVVLLNNKIKTLTPVIFNTELEKTHQYSFLVHYLKNDTQIEGLDWLSNYKNLAEMAKNKQLSLSEKTRMLAIMETDVGIHYHAWTLPQAKINLLKRLNINEDDAQYLVEDIVLYPGQSFVFSSQVLN